MAAGLSSLHLATVATDVGRPEQALAITRQILDGPLIPYMTSWATQWAAKALMHLGRTAEAAELLGTLVDRDDRGVVDVSNARRAQHLLATDRLDEASSVASRAAQTPLLDSRAVALGVLGRVALRRGLPDEALQHVRTGLSPYRAPDALLLVTELMLVELDALEAAGRGEEAASALRAAAARVRALATTLHDEEDRRVVLAMEPHAEILRRAALAGV